MILKPLMAVLLGTALLSLSWSVAHATHAPVDTNGHLLINGTEITTLPAPVCIGTAPNNWCYTDIRGTYPLGGGVNLTIASFSTSATYPARIFWDNASKKLVMRNVKITTNATTQATVNIQFLRKFPAGLAGTLTGWAAGGGKLQRGTVGAPNAKITYRGSIEIPAGGVDVRVGGLPPAPVLCPGGTFPDNENTLVLCVPAVPNNSIINATLYWDKFRNSTPNMTVQATQQWVLTGSFELILPTSQDSLQMSDSTTAGLFVSLGSAPGPGTSGGCDSCEEPECETCWKCQPCSSCPGTDKCVPKQKVSAFCMTTFSSSSAKAFDCPTCITEDGQIAQTAKIKLFANTNWDSLSQDMARGHGEHLASLARLLQVPREQHEEFFAFAQQHYRSQSLHSEDLAPEAMITGIQERWASHSMLARLDVQLVN